MIPSAAWASLSPQPEIAASHDAYLRFFENLRGLDELESLVVDYASGKAAEAEPKYQRLQEDLLHTGFSIRVIIPIVDKSAALATLADLLNTMEFSNIGAQKGVDATFDSPMGWRVQLRARGDHLLLDTALFPGLEKQPKAHHEQVVSQLGNLLESSTPPSVEGAAGIQFTTTLSALAKITFLEQMRLAEARLAAIVALPENERAAAGKAALEELGIFAAIGGLLSSAHPRKPLFDPHHQLEPGSQWRLERSDLPGLQS